METTTLSSLLKENDTERKYAALICNQILNPYTYTYTYQDKENTVLSRFILLPSPITRNYDELSCQFRRHNKYAIWREVYAHFHKPETQDQLHHSIRTYQGMNSLVDEREEIREKRRNKYRIVIHEPSNSQSWFHPLLKRTFHNVIVFTVEILIDELG